MMNEAAANHSSPEILPFEARVNLSFVRGLRTYSWTDIYQEVLADEKALGNSLDSEAELEAKMREKSVAYSLYAWIERRSQQIKYYTKWGLVRQLEDRQDLLEMALAVSDAQNADRLHLDEEFRLPDYVTAADTHQHKGASGASRQVATSTKPQQPGSAFRFLIQALLSMSTRKRCERRSFAGSMRSRCSSMWAAPTG